MKVTRAVDYALKSCLYLASRKPDAGFISVRKLCEILKLRRAYLLKVLKILQENGFVEIRRGAHGGYQLNRPPSEITIKDLVEALDGPIAINYYLQNPRECHSAVDRRIRDSWKTIQEGLIKGMKSTSLTALNPQELFKS